MELLDNINKLYNQKQTLIEIIIHLSGEGRIENKKGKLIDLKEKVLNKCNDTIKTQITDKVTCENINNYFYSYWTGSEFAKITYPLTFYSEYGHKYISLLREIIDINENVLKQSNQLITIKYNLEAYFYTIIMQWIIMKSAEYNDVSYEVYRGLDDDSTNKENDENNEYNKKYIESLSSDKIKMIDDLIVNKLIILINIAEELFNINVSDKTIDKSTYIESFEKISKINLLIDLYNDHEFIKKTYNVDITNYKIKKNLEKANKILKSEEYKNLGWRIWDSIEFYIKFKRDLKEVTTLFKSYKDKLKESNYIYHQPFSSFTLSKEIAQRPKFVGKICCFLTTRLKPKLPYLWIAGQGEDEVLFPLFSEFKVTNNDLQDIQLEYLGSRFIISDDVFRDHVEKYFKYRAMGMGATDESFYELYPEYERKVTDFTKNIQNYYNKIKTGETIVY